MKTKLSNLVISILFFNLCLSQINMSYEHSFTTGPLVNGEFFLNSFNTSQSTYYYTLGYDPYSITLYDGNYNFYKTFNIPQSVGVHEMYFITDHLFNSDDLIEFFFRFGQHLYLVNENGELLYTWSDRKDAKLIHTVDNSYKLIVYNRAGAYPYLITTDIYSLQGTLSANQTESYLDKNFTGYPIPVRESLTITNGRTINQNILVEIFNEAGQQVFSATYPAGIEEITINTNSLQSGVYIYKLNGVETKKFIKQ